jgi:hypothetical protein
MHTAQLLMLVLRTDSNINTYKTEININHE